MKQVSFKDMMKEKGIEIPTLTQKEIEQMKVDDFNASAGSLTDYDCDNARKVLSEAMVYHTAGDSIVVNVLMAIFGQLL
jgi:hypothetical protein